MKKLIFKKIWPCAIIEETAINDWKHFSLEYGINNGLNQSEAESFSEMINYFIADGPAVPKDNINYKIQKLQFDILAAMPDIKAAFEDDEIYQVKTLFDFIFIIYNEKIYQYMKKSERLEIRLTRKQLEDFNSVPGKSKADKLETLLENYYKI